MPSKRSEVCQLRDFEFSERGRSWLDCAVWYLADPRSIQVFHSSWREIDDMLIMIHELERSSIDVDTRYMRHKTYGLRARRHRKYEPESLISYDKLHSQYILRFYRFLYPRILLVHVPNIMMHPIDDWWHSLCLWPGPLRECHVPALWHDARETAVASAARPGGRFLVPIAIYVIIGCIRLGSRVSSGAPSC